MNIDIFIGFYFYFEIFIGEVVYGDSGLVVVDSKFGWVVFGLMFESGVWFNVWGERRNVYGEFCYWEDSILKFLFW